jgi:hypothetical protein
MDFKSTSLLVHVHCSDFLINTFIVFPFWVFEFPVSCSLDHIPDRHSLHLSTLVACPHPTLFPKRLLCYEWFSLVDIFFFSYEAPHTIKFKLIEFKLPV